MTLAIRQWSEMSVDQQAACLQRPAIAADSAVRESVKNIVAAVQRSGDTAARQLTQQFDGVTIDDLSVSQSELQDAYEQINERQLAAIDLAIDNVRRFHEAQRPIDTDMETMAGVRCERISHALDAVGLYVPAGTAPLPSAAIMLCVPAVIAGCQQIVLCTPPRADGSADPGVIVAADRAGVSALFKLGGAQAIAAMAYGTAAIPKVTKVFGPGNAYVTSAKSLVGADPNGAAIDMPAGPSEVLVIADGSANAEFVAADLLSQAEHGVDSQVLLLTTSREFAVNTQQAVQRQLQLLPRSDVASEALQHSSIVVLDSTQAAIELANRYAPEHLIVQLKDARKYLSGIRNAGSVFLGEWTPESVGDYCSGTNHVLPTYGYARAYSGLGVDQFLRHMTVQELTFEGLQGLGDAVITLARMEGLHAHADAVERRLRSRS